MNVSVNYITSMVMLLKHLLINIFTIRLKHAIQISLFVLEFWFIFE